MYGHIYGHKNGGVQSSVDYDSEDACGPDIHAKCLTARHSPVFSNASPCPSRVRTRRRTWAQTPRRGVHGAWAVDPKTVAPSHPHTLPPEPPVAALSRLLWPLSAAAVAAAATVSPPRHDSQPADRHPNRPQPTSAFCPAPPPFVHLRRPTVVTPLLRFLSPSSSQSPTHQCSSALVLEY